MDTERVLLRDKNGAVVTTKDVTPDTQRVEHDGRWFRRGGGGSAVRDDPVRTSFHEEPEDG